MRINKTVRQDRSLMIEPTICCMFYLYIHHSRENRRRYIQVKWTLEPGVFPACMIRTSVQLCVDWRTKKWGVAGILEWQFVKAGAVHSERSAAAGVRQHPLCATRWIKCQEWKAKRKDSRFNSVKSWEWRGGLCACVGGWRKDLHLPSPIRGVQWYNQAVLRARRRRREPGIFTFFSRLRGATTAASRGDTWQSRLYVSPSVCEMSTKAEQCKCSGLRIYVCVCVRVCVCFSLLLKYWGGGGGRGAGARQLPVLFFIPVVLALDKRRRVRGAVLGDETAVAMAGCNTSSHCGGWLEALEETGSPPLYLHWHICSAIRFLTRPGIREGGKYN